jgi:hypothetical protein
MLPHNIDLMHQERNILENIISMCLDVTGFMKDDMNAWKDLGLCVIVLRWRLNQL